MAKRASSSSNRKLIDRLQPDLKDGHVEAILATSYEFDPDFFDTDLLPTLLGLGAWDDLSWRARVALERELAATSAVALAVDAGPYREQRPRSLRVDLRAASEPGRIMHAKVTVVVQPRAVRLAVGSANITANGYRNNREAVTVLVASEKNRAHAALIAAALENAPAALGPWWSPACEQVRALAQSRVAPWVDGPSDAASFVWSGGKDRLFERFVEEWPQNEPIRRLRIISPFWSEEVPTGPLTTFIAFLRRRSLLAADAEVDLYTEARAIQKDRFLPMLPPSYATLDIEQLAIRARVWAVDPRVSKDEIERDAVQAIRCLHAKVLLVEGAKTSLAYVGSANFTAQGWGFSDARAHVEAGLLVRGRRGGLDALIPPITGEACTLAEAATTKIQLEGQASGTPWPRFIDDVRLVEDVGHPDCLHLRVRVNVEDVAGAWRLTLPGSNGAMTLVEAGPGGGAEHVVALSAEALRTLLREQHVIVQWWACTDSTAFPINVDEPARDALPIAPDAKKPGEHDLVSYYQGRIAWEELFAMADDDATSKQALSFDGKSLVDTTRIQSYQIREFVEALRGIRDDLKSAVRSEAAMRFALRGPVSPIALAREVFASARGGKRTAVAAGFQLLEIRACVLDARNYAPEPHREQWRKLVDSALADLDQLLTQLRAEQPGALDATGFHTYATALAAHFEGHSS